MGMTYGHLEQRMFMAAATASPSLNRCRKQESQDRRRRLRQRIRTKEGSDDDTEGNSRLHTEQNIHQSFEVELHTDVNIPGYNSKQSKPHDSFS